MSKLKVIAVYAIILIIITATPACSNAPSPETSIPPLNRESKIPLNAVKMSPQTDENPPVLLSDEYEDPVPIPGEVNTAGGEDSPFISPDGKTLYFFFTPDVSIPAEKQLIDGVTGIYVSRLINGNWATPERVILQDPGKLALDGCAFVQNDRMWFCSAREGYSGLNWFTAEYKNGRWQDWKLAGFNPAYEIGELHISNDAKELYFASGRSGGKGQLDIWVSIYKEGEWQEPENISAVNTPDSEGWPALSSNGNELWFTRNYGIWRSKKVNGEWQAPEQIVSNLAGEASLDAAGNVYFVHHYFKSDKMIEADIYIAVKK